MANLLLSGPAGGGKSQVARELLDEAEELTAVADFQSLYAAIALQVRGPDGKFPLRDERLLPLVEYVRRAVITGAKSRDIAIIATNSDGSPDRRQFLLGELGQGATERVIDPGQLTVEARLSDGKGKLSKDCKKATERWYKRHKGQSGPIRRFFSRRR